MNARSRDIPASKIRSARAALLMRLRYESKLAAGRRVRINIDDTPALFALVIASLTQHGDKFVWHEGIKFPVRNGWLRAICCPETGEALAAVSGGLVV